MYDIDGTKLTDMLNRNEASQNLQLQSSRDQSNAQLQQREQLQLLQREKEQIQLSQRDHASPQQLHQRDKDQLQYQQRDREQLHRDKLHQLQSISNLFLDVPSPTNFQGYSHDSLCMQPNKSNNVDGTLLPFSMLQ